MKLLDRICKRSGKPYRDPTIFLLAAVCSVILFYFVFAYPFYTELKVKDIKAAYHALAEVNFAELSVGDEEDTEILQGLSGDKFEIIITDDKFQIVYSNIPEKLEKQNDIVERKIVLYKEVFQEEPCIYVRKNENFCSIRLRGLLTQEEGPEAEIQGEEQKTYYVYIRLVVRSIGTVIQGTTKYLCLAAGLMFLLGYLLLRIRSVKLVLIPEQAYEEKMYGMKYGGAAYQGKEEDQNIRSGQQEESGRDESDEKDRKAQQEFVASVSHELKTPLAVISGQMEMLQSMGDRIDQDYYFTSIREEIDKMSRLVGNLLDLTIMEHQMEDMELCETDFSEMVQYMTQKYEALFQKNRISLTTEIEKNCTVYGNRTYLEQAVNNYIMNAFQHTPQGKEIRVVLAREDKSVKLSVYNEGSHVPPEKLGQIWKGFYKESGSSRTNLREFRNAGLGLYFVRKITEAHHGDCGARNMEEGVEFWLTLPPMGETKYTEIIPKNG